MSGPEEVGLAFIKEYTRGWGVVGPVMELAGGVGGSNPGKGAGKARNDAVTHYF
jgi:hypothetical protein